MIHSKEATIQIGEPQLGGEENDSEETSDTQEAQTPENGGGTTDANQVSEGENAGEDTTEGDTGTSTDSLEDSSTGDYSDYLDTITELISSLVKLKND